MWEFFNLRCCLLWNDRESYFLTKLNEHNSHEKEPHFTPQKSGKRKNFTRKSCQFVNNWDVFLCAKKSDIAESQDNEIIVGFKLIKKVEMVIKIVLRTTVKSSQARDNLKIIRNGLNILLVINYANFNHFFFKEIKFHIFTWLSMKSFFSCGKRPCRSSIFHITTASSIK